MPSSASGNAAFCVSRRRVVVIVSQTRSTAAGLVRRARASTSALMSPLTNGTGAEACTTSTSRYRESRSSSARSRPSVALRRACRLWLSCSSRHCARTWRGSSSGVATPMLRSHSSFWSCWAASTAAVDSSVAMSRSSCAAWIAPGTPTARPGVRSTSRRRRRASGSSASRRATPMCPCEAAAAQAASPGLTPWRCWRTRATASARGTPRVTTRQRLRMVGSRSSTNGAHSTQMVCGGGSSTSFSSMAAATSRSRSASSTTTTTQRPRVGATEARRTRWTTTSLRTCISSVASTVTSG